MKKGEVKWVTLNNITGEKALKQHGFKPRPRRPPFNEGYLGNISLCGKVAVSNENEENEAYAFIEGEPVNREKACKKCLKHAGL